MAAFTSGSAAVAVIERGAVRLLLARRLYARAILLARVACVLRRPLCTLLSRGHDRRITLAYSLHCWVRGLRDSQDLKRFQVQKLGGAYSHHDRTASSAFVLGRRGSCSSELSCRRSDRVKMEDEERENFQRAEGDSWEKNLGQRPSDIVDELAATYLVIDHPARLPLQGSLDDAVPPFVQGKWA